MAEANKPESSSQRPLDGGEGKHICVMPKRKHRRGKKSKMVPKKHNKNHGPPWKLDMQPASSAASGSGAGSGGEAGKRHNARVKLMRSRSLLVPYNTNRFLMEEHMSELPKDDSDDNCFGSQTEVLFLSKEFSNVYERARLERLETMSKQELIQECLQIEDRYSKAQNVSKECGAKLRSLEDKLRQLTRENQFLRSHFLRSCSTPPGGPAAAAVAAAAASPPSAAAPTPSSASELQARQQPPNQQQPTPMDSSSEDSESDSSSTTSSTTSSTSSSGSSDDHAMGVAGLNIANGHAERSVHSCSRSRSRSRSPIQLNGHANDEERSRLLDDEENSNEGITNGSPAASK